MRGTTTEADAIVVGGGIVGMCTAGFLAAGGMRVVLVDADLPGGSNANAGSLHVQMQSRFMQIYPHLVAGLEATLHLYPKAARFWAAMEKETGERFELKYTGGLMVAESREQLDFLAYKADRERALGLDVEVLGRAALREIAPYLGPAVIGGELCRLEGKLNPLLANAAIRRWARRHGVQPVAAEIRRVERARSRFALRAPDRTFTADRLVLAAGAGTRKLAADLGVHVPADAEPLHMNVTEAVAPFITHLVQHADRPITVKQLAAGNVVIGGGWPANLARERGLPSVLLASLVGNATLAQHIVPAIGGLRIARAWAGVNTVVDGRGVLGEAAAVPGLFIAVPGDAGYTLGPLSARLVADVVLGCPPGEDIIPYSPDRFRGAETGKTATAADAMRSPPPQMESAGKVSSEAPG
jgi:glycine/D-amino acid oxidase-like deaminating enzyme